MGSLLTALASIGSQYATGKEEARQEKESTREKQQQLGVEQAHLDLARQANQRQQEEFEFRRKAGDLIPLDKNGVRFWSVSQNKLVEFPPATSSIHAMDALKDIIKRYKPDQQQRLSLIGQAELEADPNNYPAAIKAVLAQADKLDQEQRTAAEKRLETETKAAEEQKRYERTLADRRTDFEEHRKEHREDMESLKLFSAGLAAQKPTSDEVRRADLANNVNENLDAIEDIVTRRPDLFGPAAGRLTTLRSWTGTGDTDIAAIEQIKDNLGAALRGAHNLRSAQGVVTASNSVLNSFHNQPKAILSAVDRARNSVKTFTLDVQRKADALQRMGVPGGIPGATKGAPGTTTMDSNNPLGIDLTPPKVP